MRLVGSFSMNTQKGKCGTYVYGRSGQDLVGDVLRSAIIHSKPVLYVVHAREYLPSVI